VRATALRAPSRHPISATNVHLKLARRRDRGTRESRPRSQESKQGSEAQAEGDRRRRLGRKLSNPERPPREEPDELTIVCLGATQRNRDKHSVLVAAVASILSYCAASAQNQPSQDQTSAPTEFQNSTRNKPAIVTIPEAATDTPGVPVSQTSGSNLTLAGGSVRVSATTRLAISAPSGGMREGRVLSTQEAVVTRP
jgi:hypothetical protein